MLLRLVEEKRPIDEILYCDTGWEFPQMYDHLDRLEQTIGRPITRLKAPLTAEQYFYEYTARPDAKLVTDRGLSWPSHACRWCTGRLKTHVINKHLRQLRRQYRLKQYVGIAADEAHRCKDLPLQPLSELRKLRVHCPDLWQKLLYMDAHTWQPFRQDYTARQLDIRFKLEEERTAQGLPLTGRVFYTALDDRLEQEGHPRMRNKE